MNNLENYKSVHIIGAGGFAVEISHLLSSKYADLSIFLYADSFEEYNNVRPLDSLLNSIEPTYCVIAIGDNAGRSSIVDRLAANTMLKFLNIDFRDHSAYPDSEQNVIGIGNIIMPNATIGVSTSIGSFNIIGSGTGFGHHVNIGDFNFIGPNSFLAGSVHLGSFCTISFGTGFLQKVHIGSAINSLPYTVFYKSNSKSGTYAGNPANKIM